MHKLLSIVIPIHNEAKNIPELYRQLEEIRGVMSDRYATEYIFVNDGSGDASSEILDGLAARDTHTRIIDFSRNFGKEAATSAGVHYAAGDAVVIMDADLQHPPSVIPLLIAEWEKGVEVVYTVRKAHGHHQLFRWLGSRLYYWLMRHATDLPVEPLSTDFRLLDRKVVDAFNKLTERGRVFRGIIDWMGFRRARVEFDSPKRLFGKNAYTFRKLVGLFTSSITSFSMLPLRLTGYLGIVIIFFSSLFLLYIIVAQYTFNWVHFSGPFIGAVLNMLLIGVVLSSLGLIALYVGNIHAEVVNRPLYIIREKKNLS